jgi:hypothetical protein
MAAFAFLGEKLMRILILEINHKFGGILNFSATFGCPKFSFHENTFLFALFFNTTQILHALLLQLSFSKSTISDDETNVDVEA